MLNEEAKDTLMTIFHSVDAPKQNSLLTRCHEIGILNHESTNNIQEHEMANLQIKGIDDKLYDTIKSLAASENRSVSQEMLFLVKEHLAKRKQITAVRTPAEVLLDLSGSWTDERSADTIIAEIKAARKGSRKLSEGL